MPGWPAVDRAHDLELVAALRRADPGAPERLYDAYGDRLHDYAASLLGDRRAADAVHDAVVTAQGCADRLREPARLRAWLYALVRFQAMARLGHHRGAAAPLDDPDDHELAELVGATLGEMRRSEREILELSTRHGLTPAEVGSVLGLTSRQAASRLRRSRDLLENAAAAVVLARTGRAHCPELSALVDSWEGPLTPPLRRRLAAHIGGCEVCTERRRAQVSAARLLEMLPVAYAPFSLRERVLGTCADPALGDTRTMILDRGDGFDRGGFPAPPGRSRRRGRRGLAPALLAAAALLAGTAVLVAMTGHEGAKTALDLRPEGSPTAHVLPESPPAETEEESGPTPSPSESGRERTPSPKPTRRPAADLATTRPPAVSTPTRRRAARPARLTTTCPEEVAGAATIGLRARNRTVSWKAAASEGLGVVPAAGSIKPGGTAVVWVTVEDPGTEGSGTVTITSNGGGSACALSWDDPAVPGPTRLPDDDVTASAGPTGTPVPEAASSSSR
ncbi:RNA polymerase sigma factor [Nonomuraea harbinensis]|uniref:RNA polymerase sigma factor n=1 Tax=Nonomuraea harbinensis TaxID=1286938 RepID=UPI001C5EDC2F|nr:sigma-70 family RNA polymerase sigma factor [Nonomuraea harbinensis]